MRRSSPQKIPSRDDIEQGGGKRTVNPIRNMDPPSSSLHYTNNQPLHKVLTRILRDTLYGTLLGLLFLTLLFTLDYHSLISIGSTKAFQQVGQELLSDPEVITAIENSLSLKLLPLSHYEGIQLEIESNNKLVSSTQGSDGALAKHTAELTVLKEEIASLQSEYDTVTKYVNEKLGLDQWCGECKGPWGLCDGRVEYLRSTYGNNVFMSKVDLMKEGLCKKS